MQTQTPTKNPTGTPSEKPSGAPTPQPSAVAGSTPPTDCSHLLDPLLEGTEGTLYTFGDAVSLVEQLVDSVAFSVTQVWSDPLVSGMAVLTTQDSLVECPASSDVTFGTIVEYTAECTGGLTKVNIFVGEGISTCPKSIPSDAVAYTHLTPFKFRTPTPVEHRFVPHTDL
jgi:hypothetical protein